MKGFFKFKRLNIHDIYMKDKLEKIEADLFKSIEGIKPVEAPPYFYTRLVARMERERENNKQQFTLLRPSFLASSLSFILIINIIFLLKFNDVVKYPVSSKQTGNKATIESFTNEYGLNSAVVYE
jgi:type IV secretory pathway component VirB8